MLIQQFPLVQNNLLPKKSSKMLLALTTIFYIFFLLTNTAKGRSMIRPAGCDNVIETPRIQLTIQAENDGTVPTGGKIDLSCEAFGAPQATVHWVFNGRRLSDRRALSNDPAEEQVNGGMAVVGASIVMARFSKPCVSASDAGMYTCVADNGCVSKLMQIEVKVDPDEQVKCVSEEDRSRRAGDEVHTPPSIIMWTDTRIERNDAAAQLFCRVDQPKQGEAPDKVDWMLVDEEDNEWPVDQEEHVRMHNGDLLVKGGRTSGPAGRHYVCQVENPFGVDRRDIILVDVLVRLGKQLTLVDIKIRVN